MAPSYPNTIASLTNPTATDAQNSVSVPHATQHTNANDEIEAIETELGLLPKGAFASVRARLDAYSAVYTAFTPSFFSGSPTLGTGSVNLGRYHTLGKAIKGTIGIKFGTGASGGSGNWTLAMPVAPYMGFITAGMSSVLCGDFTVNNGGTSAADHVVGSLHYYNNGGTATFIMIGEPGSSVGVDYIGSANPWTWTSGCQLWLNFQYEAA